MITFHNLAGYHFPENRPIQHIPSQNTYSVCQSWGWPGMPVSLMRFWSRFNSMETSSCCNSITGPWIATIFRTCHDSTAIVVCAKFCSDCFVGINVRAQQNFVSEMGHWPGKPYAGRITSKFTSKIRHLARHTFLAWKGVWGNWTSF